MGVPGRAWASSIEGRATRQAGKRRAYHIDALLPVNRSDERRQATWSTLVVDFIATSCSPNNLATAVFCALGLARGASDPADESVTLCGQ